MTTPEFKITLPLVQDEIRPLTTGLSAAITNLELELAQLKDALIFVRKACPHKNRTGGYRCNDCGQTWAGSSDGKD